MDVIRGWFSPTDPFIHCIHCSTILSKLERFLDSRLFRRAFTHSCALRRRGSPAGHDDGNPSSLPCFLHCFSSVLHLLCFPQLLLPFFLRVLLVRRRIVPGLPHSWSAYCVENAANNVYDRRDEEHYSPLRLRRLRRVNMGIRKVKHNRVVDFRHWPFLELHILRQWVPTTLPDWPDSWWNSWGFRRISVKCPNDWLWIRNRFHRSIRRLS